MSDATHAQECWRPIPGFEGIYEASDFGRVRSIDRIYIDALDRPRRLKGKVLSPGKNREGRESVQLCAGGEMYGNQVAAFVLMAFVGPRPHPLAVACHNDGNCRDNRLSNLRWDTRRENALDSVRHGTHASCRGGGGAPKSHCKWGHPLVAPNLSLDQSGRHCLACSRARGFIRYQRRAGRPVSDHQSLADRYYDQLTP